MNYIKLGKFLIRFIGRNRRMQNDFGFYKSGIKNEQIWLGLELPYVDIRIIKFIGERNAHSQ